MVAVDLLGRADPPVFLHHPLICVILGQAAYLTGLLATPRELRPADLAGVVSAG
jgi:hypothetical protein